MTSTTQSSPRPPDTLPKVPAEVWRVAAVVITGSFMSTLGSSLVNVGLKTIAGVLHAPLSNAQWVATGYLIAFAAALPVTAWLSRRMGAGRLWLCALAGFTVASAACSLAPNLGALIALRAVQGLCGALLVPTGQTVIGEIAGPERMGRVLNATKIVVVLGPVIGPTIGGLLIRSLSWHWLFLVNVPVGVVALALGSRLVPRGVPTKGRPFDFGGFLLIAAGLPLVLYGITIAERQGLTDTRVLATLLSGIVAMALFAWRSLTVDTPVLDLRLFRNRVYTAATTSVFFTGAALLGTMILLPLYYQLIRHEGVVTSGLLMLGIGCGSALSMPFGGPITDRVGGGIVSAAGLTLSLAGVLPMAFLDARTGYLILLPLQAAVGFGLGLSAMPSLSVAYATVPRERLPDATSEANIIQRVGGAVGTAVLVMVLETNGTATDSSFHRACFWLAGAVFIALCQSLWLTKVESSRRKQELTRRSTPKG
ncbi:multidrug efflux MFS transporter [Streptomyces sp. NBC_00669]|uniref:MDR family MFS transporter n=1 Tax=unclassified Streptomyces TaxID=2593676 RepID=UPI002E32E5D4|nr:MDR family MFS transporter [Streptomyces sp. NBC_00669]